MGKPSTLREVAARAHVSLKTASRVINHDPHVADATRAAVFEAVRELDYRPDLAARSLRRGHDQIVGLVVDDIGDPFFAQLAAGVERVLDSAGYRVYIASARHDVAREREIVEELLQRRCAGLLVAPATDDSLVDLRAGVHLVYVDRSGRRPGSPSVVTDDFESTKRATLHLADHGHTRIGVVSEGPILGTTRARLAGYRAGMEAAELPVDPDLVRLDAENAAQAATATRMLLELSEPATAVISMNRRVSVGVVATLHGMGRTDVAFISFGDFEMAGVLTPAATVIDHTPETLGRVAAELLLRQLALTPADGETSIVTVPAILIERGSGELRP